MSLCGGNKRTLCKNKDCDYCFNRSFASHPKAKNWSDKNNLTPGEVLKGTDTKYIFGCDTCKHEFFIQLNSVSIRGQWCSICSRTRMCDNVNCEYCFENSFAASKFSENWSNKNVLRPNQVFKNTNKNYIFNCNMCHHEFECRPANIINNDSSGCPYCNGNTLCDNNECIYCFNRSFASHPKSQEWSAKNSHIPRKIRLNSNIKFWFDCILCNHTYTASPSNINRGMGCSYCCEFNSSLCDDNNCNQCFNRSFASHFRSKNWSNKNAENPRSVLLRSNKKYIFDCNDCGHDYIVSLTNLYKGIWCTCTKNKTESLFYGKVFQICETIEKQSMFEWCKSKKHNRRLPFDFCIEKYKILIEIDGRQHFKQVGTWDSPEKQHNRDIYKQNLALLNGYTVIRILQEDVWLDRNDWLNKLKTHLHFHKKPAAIYISGGDEYKIFEKPLTFTSEDMAEINKYINGLFDELK